MSSTPWPEVSQVTLADQCYDAIRARILDGGMALGEFVREQDVSAALGVSRTPVREALGRLASEGFLERIPHRGFRVPEEPLDTLMELYPIVAALEALAGRLALPHLTAEDLAELRALNRELRAGRNDADTRRRAELNARFHRLICSRSGSARLCDLLEDLRSQVNRLECWYYAKGDRTDETAAQRDEFIAFIEAGRFDEAVRLLERNMALTCERFAAER